MNSSPETQPHSKNLSFLCAKDCKKKHVENLHSSFSDELDVGGLGDCRAEAWPSNPIAFLQ